MAKPRRSTSQARTDDAAGSSPGDRLTRTLSETAQQIWLAGMGAFARAQAEGTKLFDALIKEGLNLEQSAQQAADRADAARESAEARFERARERAAGTWDQLERAFEERVRRALGKLGVPDRDEIAGLRRRVDALTAELRRRDAAATRKAAARRSPAPKKTAAKTAAGKGPRRTGPRSA